MTIDAMTIKAIALPEFSERERALRAASTEGSSYRPAAGKETAQINDGILLVFDSALTDQPIADISNSVLFAQLAADAQYNRFSASKEWAMSYFDVLGQVGWDKSGFETSGSNPLPLPVDWAQLVVRFMSGSAASLSDTGVRAARDLPQTSMPMKIWNANALDANKGLLLVGSAQLIRDNITLSVTLTSLEFQRSIGGFLQWNLAYLVESSWAGLELNEDVYSRVRDAIIKKLGDRPRHYVANVPIKNAA